MMTSLLWCFSSANLEPVRCARKCVKSKNITKVCGFFLQRISVVVPYCKNLLFWKMFSFFVVGGHPWHSPIGTYAYTKTLKHIHKWPGQGCKLWGGKVSNGASLFRIIEKKADWTQASSLEEDHLQCWSGLRTAWKPLGNWFHCMALLMEGISPYLQSHPPTEHCFQESSSVVWMTPSQVPASYCQVLLKPCCT